MKTAEKVLDLKMFINGQWASAAEHITITSPVTGEEIARMPRGTRVDVARAVEAARSSQSRFAATTVFERSKLCRAIADEIMKNQSQLARYLTLEQGKPFHAEALGEVEVAAQIFRMAAEEILRLNGEVMPSADPNKRVFALRQARGVYGVITPWNFPFAIPAQYLAYGLAAGNAIVWTPAPVTAGCAVKLMECIHTAGLAPGVLNLVLGEGAIVGDEIAGHAGIDALGFTGSSTNGLLVSRRAAGKPQLLELGGNGPTIVLSDADVKQAALRAGRGAFANAGQICDSTERIMVHRSIHDEFVSELIKVAKEFKQGDPFEEGVKLGPVISENQSKRIEKHLQEAVSKGAVIVCGGSAAKGYPTGQYLPATVVDRVSSDMLLNVEETFGPVAPVLTFSNDDEALALANSGSTGLAASIFSSDIGKALRLAENVHAGMVNLNETTCYWELHLPFGGYSGKQSGVGRVGARSQLLEMTQVKSIIMDFGK